MRYRELLTENIDEPLFTLNTNFKVSIDFGRPPDPRDIGEKFFWNELYPVDDPKVKELEQKIQDAYKELSATDMDIGWKKYDQASANKRDYMQKLFQTIVYNWLSEKMYALSLTQVPAENFPKANWPLQCKKLYNYVIENSNNFQRISLNSLEIGRAHV